MHQLKFFHFPRACSRVTMCALEHAGFEYDDQVINIMKGEQKSPDYLKINPSGQVPALLVDGDRNVVQNASILLFLHSLKPEAGLLPATDELVEQAQQRSDLIWLSSTLHPMVRQVLMAMRFTDGDPSGVRAKGVEMLDATLPGINARLANAVWWYGEEWSIVDTYLSWAMGIAIAGGYPILEQPAIAGHLQRVMSMPVMQTVMAREEAAIAAHNIQFPS